MTEVKRRGRVRIDKENVEHCSDCIRSWISSDTLHKWLSDKEDWFKAAQAFDKAHRDHRRSDDLDAWRKQWLSDKGWTRLKANIRQRQHMSGKTSEKRCNISLKQSTLQKLNSYASDQGLTQDEAILALLLNKKG